MSKFLSNVNSVKAKLLSQYILLRPLYKEFRYEIESTG